MSLITKNINFNKDLFIVNIPNNINDISFQTKLPNNISNTYTVLWDSIINETITIEKNSIINWIMNTSNLFIIKGKVFFDNCIIDNNLLLNKNKTDIFTYFNESGYYYFSSKNCNNKILIIVK